MYCFIFFVISIVQNIFMVIVEDSYISIKYAKNFDWLTKQDDDKKPDGEGDGHDDHPHPPNQPN